MKYLPLAVAAVAIYASASAAETGRTSEPSRRSAMREIPDASKFTISNATTGAPNKKGWYHHAVNVVDTPEGLVCVYRRTDAHTSILGNIMVARSTDGGRSWTDHQAVAYADVWNEGGVWVAPQLSRLRDGRLVIICDFGQRRANQGHPMLSLWQKPEYGMSNHLFWSSDNGRTWDGPHKIDDVGGEPGYIIELSDGTLMYTRTESRETDKIWNPPLPWGGNYYRNGAVVSTDGGRTWERRSSISDDPLQGDCEVGLVELAPGKLLAVTRIGFGNAQFGQPSRFIYSDDGGHTWGRHTLSPIYGQRTAVHKLRSGKLLVTYRNWWGTPGSYALVFDAGEKLPYQPTSFIWDEGRTTIKDGAMTINTAEGPESGVIFALYPAQAPDSRVEFEAELRVESADVNGVHISAGCDVKIEPRRISLHGRASDGFEIDATQWRKYRIVRESGMIEIYVDGELKLKKPTTGLETRLVRFGNRQTSGWSTSLHRPDGLKRIIGERANVTLGEASVSRRPVSATGEPLGAPANVTFGNASVSHWRSLAVKVENKNDHSIDWQWSARDGFPDQFRRDRIVRLDRTGSRSPGDSGYSSWTERPDGTVVIVDYTTGNPPAAVPFARAYLTTEEFLMGTASAGGR
jgi:hypothetical protein